MLRMDGNSVNTRISEKQVPIAISLVICPTIGLVVNRVTATQVKMSMLADVMTLGAERCTAFLTATTPVQFSFSSKYLDEKRIA